METTTAKIKIPKRGWQQELAKSAGCTVQTVINALHYNSAGKKSEKVRQLYKIKYQTKL